MKKTYIYTIITAIFLVLAGCSSSGGTNNSGYNLDTFNGGDEAMTLSFRDNAPPSKIRDGGLQPFQVILEIQNVGEYDIGEGEAHVSLSGFDSSAINLVEDSQSLQELRGVKKQGGRVIDGTKTQVIFSNLKYLPELPSGVHIQPIYANLCYPYKTKSLASLCVSGDTLVSYDDEDSKICDLEGAVNYANSGAPLRIENFEQFPAGQSSIQFQFEIVHNPTPNSGKLYRENSIDNDCKINGNSPSSVDAQLSKDYVQFKVETGIAGLECNGATNSGEVQLSNNRAIVYCTQDTSGQEEYVKPITIELSYDYLERISKELTIEHISR